MKKVILLGAVLTTLVTCGVFAEDAASPTPTLKKQWDLTPEQRQDMAKIHDQMAACLRSDKPVTQCRDQMRKSCVALGQNGCPMMGQGRGMGRGAGRSG